MFLINAELILSLHYYENINESHLHLAVPSKDSTYKKHYLVSKRANSEQHRIAIFFTRFVGASLNEPHSNVESGAVVHAQRTTTKNGIATHYCSLGMVVHVQMNTINLRILPYKCIVLQKYLASFTDIP